MKKILIILGSLFLIIIIAIGAMIGFAAYKGTKLDSSSKAYIETNLPHIISPWSALELDRRASPQFKMAVDKQTIEQLFRKLSELGKNNSIGTPEGSSFMSYTTEGGKQITAKYIVPCSFENGEAVIKISLIMQNEQWLILGFHVDSPIFLN